MKIVLENLSICYNALASLSNDLHLLKYFHKWKKYFIIINLSLPSPMLPPPARYALDCITFPIKELLKINQTYSYSTVNTPYEYSKNNTYFPVLDQNISGMPQVRKHVECRRAFQIQPFEKTHMGYLPSSIHVPCLLNPNWSENFCVELQVLVLIIRAFYR